jgi:hypothetical protein
MQGLFKDEQSISSVLNLKEKRYAASSSLYQPAGSLKESSSHSGTVS